MRVGGFRHEICEAMKVRSCLVHACRIIVFGLLMMGHGSVLGQTIGPSSLKTDSEGPCGEFVKEPLQKIRCLQERAVIAEREDRLSDWLALHQDVAIVFGKVLKDPNRSVVYLDSILSEAWRQPLLRQRSVLGAEG